MTNDFEAVVARTYPQVRAALAALRDAGAERPMLSGSGGACFALAPDERGARELALALRPPEDAAVHVVPFAETPAWR
jgi:4-diphosphocytidyl-2-C-methyl-D-erythritol kinase